jgi:hypothetical protein
VAKGNAPAALFLPPDQDFSLRVRVTVDFGATYDAGVLCVYAQDQTWANLCFEYSPQNQPMIVSVVTRGASDDCNSVVVAAARSTCASTAGRAPGSFITRWMAAPGIWCVTLGWMPGGNRRCQAKLLKICALNLL